MATEIRRDATYDNLKFMMIFLVVLGHLVNAFDQCSENLRSVYMHIYFYHMPVFIFVSGLFAKRTINEKNYRKLFEYLVIYIFIKLFLFLANSLIIGKVANLRLFVGSGTPWYVLALFFCCAITMCLKNVDKRYLFIGAVALACFAGYDKQLGDFLAILRTIVFYPFFLAGYYMDAATVKEKLSKPVIRIGALVVLVAFTMIVFGLGDALYEIRPLLSGRNTYGFLDAYVEWGFVIRLLYYVAVFVLIFAWIAVTPSKECILSKWGRNSLYVYILHYPFFFIAERILRKSDAFMDLMHTSHYLILLVMAVVITVVFSLGFWGKILNPILKPKWNRSESEIGNE